VILTSKYEMGQRVWSIHSTRVQRADRTCGACDGAKVVELRGSKYECPSCNGKGEVHVFGHGWVISGHGCVGKISIEHCAPFYEKRYGDERAEGGRVATFVTYMLDSTGIGSGTVYEEPNLWPSREEAQAECNRRNGSEVAP
jgi:hypothetical protein